MAFKQFFKTFFMGQPQATFSFIFNLFKQYNTVLQQINVKKSIQYQAPGFELTTLWFRVSYLNH